MGTCEIFIVTRGFFFLEISYSTVLRVKISFEFFHVKGTEKFFSLVKVLYEISFTKCLTFEVDVLAINKI